MGKFEEPAMTMQESETDVKREKVADHKLLDAAGNYVDNEEQASGYEYTLVDGGHSFRWMWNEANETERMMLANFGAKTLATNETSALRNSEKRKGLTVTGQEQITAVESRFALLRTGQWLAPSEGGVGIRVDKPKLATAIVTVKIAAGKTKESDRDSEYAHLLERLESEPDYVKGVRTNTAVLAEYAKLQGKATMSVDDL